MSDLVGFTEKSITTIMTQQSNELKSIRIYREERNSLFLFSESIMPLIPNVDYDYILKSYIKL